MEGMGGFVCVLLLFFVRGGGAMGECVCVCVFWGSD